MIALLAFLLECAAVAALIGLAASLGVAPIAGAGARLTATWSAARRADLLFTLGVLPALLAVTLVLAAPAAAAAEPPAELTGDGFVERVLSTSLDARIAEAEAALARAEVAGAGRWPNPSVAWQREHARAAGGSESQDVFVASVPLVLSGRLGLERDAAGLTAEAAEARRQRARGALHREAVVSFSAALAASERRRLLEASVTALRRVSEAIAAREQAGDAAGYERLRIEVEVASVEDLLRAAVLDERAARAEVARLLSVPAGALPALAGAVAPERAGADVTALLAELERNRADLRALALEARGAERSQRAAARSWIPEPTVTAGAQVLDLGQTEGRSGYVVGVSLPLPLFERGQGPRARAEAHRALAEVRREALLRDAHTLLLLAAETAAGRRERLLRHQTNVVARALELRRIAGAAYRGGGAELLVLVDAERAAREAQLARIGLELEVAEAEASLLFLAGVYDRLEQGSTNR